MGVGPGLAERCPGQVEDFAAQRVSGPAGTVVIDPGTIQELSVAFLAPLSHLRVPVH